MRTCFLHIGTHKTGTTSLQVMLNRHRADLEGQHYLYPRTGRPTIAPDGHHNIAWEISGDWRFKNECGTIDDLVTEILTTSHNVILSSEDFECSVHHPARFQQFVWRLQSCQLAVKIVIYFRNQVDYAQTLYLTMLQFGIVASFDEFLDDILEDGQYRYRDWTFNFSYKSLLERLRAIDGIDVIVRSYDRPMDGSLIVDYLSILGLVSETLGVDTTIRENSRLNIIDAVGLFYGNRKGSPPDRLERYIIGAMFEPVKDERLGLSRGSKLRIWDNFRESADAVFPGEGTAGLEEGRGTDPHLDRPDDILLMESVFSSELVDHLDSIAAALRAGYEGDLNQCEALGARGEALPRERDNFLERCRTLLTRRDDLARE